MTDMALIPYGDYQAAADQARTLRGTSAAIKSGELPGMLEAANTEVDTQTGLINELIEQANNLPEAGSGGGAEPVIQALEVTENGTYTPPDGVDGYAPVTVAVPVPEPVRYNSSGQMYAENVVVPEGVTTLASNIYNISGILSIYATDVTVLSGHYCFGGAWNSLQTLIAPKLVSWGGAYWCRGGDLHYVQAGSIGNPVVSMPYNKGFDLNSNSDLVIEIYVDATTLEGVPSDISSYAPFGATNATIVYRNSTTGEVITA